MKTKQDIEKELEFFHKIKDLAIIENKDKDKVRNVIAALNWVLEIYDDDNHWENLYFTISKTIKGL